MFDFLFTKVAGIPVFYIVPIMFFGPILIWAMYNIGIGNVVFLPGEIMRKMRRDREDRDKLIAERQKKMGAAERVIKKTGKRSPLQWIGQAAVYGLLGLPIAYYSNNPTYRLHDPNEAEIRLSLTKAGLHAAECRQRSPEEMAKLPPQARRKQVCGRERSPVTLQLEVDGKVLFERMVQPSGLSKDGPSVFYAKFLVPAGKHRLIARMKTKPDTKGYDYVLDEEITLAPRQGLVVSHRVEEERLILKW